MGLTAAEKAVGTKYDLTGDFFPYLERQVLYVLAQELEKVAEDQSAIVDLKKGLLKGTNLFALAKEVGVPAADIAEREAAVNGELEALTASTKDIIAALNANKGSFTQDKAANRQLLMGAGISEAQINELFALGKLQYNRGDYTLASDLLSNFKSLSNNQALLVEATWGKLASNINAEEYEDAQVELTKLQEVLETKSMSALEQLKFRLSLAHYALFVYLPRGKYSELLEVLMTADMLSAIENGAPWLLRYAVAAMFLSGEFKRCKDLVRAVNVETYEYSDPLTTVFQVVFSTLDFTKLNDLLVGVSALCKTDYFLAKAPEGTLVKNVTTAVLRAVLRVYSGLTLESLSQVVKLEDKYVQECAQVVVGEDGVLTLADKPAAADLYHQVYEKTKALNYKSTQMAEKAFH